jgi:hypothetical protein
MQTSSINLICSASWPSSSAELVSISGKSRRILCAVIGSACVSVVVADILVTEEVQTVWQSIERALVEEIKQRTDIGNPSPICF